MIKKKIISFFFLILCFTVTPVTAQTTTDSLKQELSKANDQEKYDICLELMNIYLSVDLDTALIYAKEALKIAVESKNDSLLASAHKKTGIVYYYGGDTENALKSFEKAAEYYENLKDLYETGNILNNIGILHSDWGNYDKSLEYYNKAIEYYNRVDSISSVGSTTGNIGTVYLSVGNYEKAIEYFEKSMKIAESQNDRSLVASNLNNIGLVYQYWGKFEDAVTNYQSSLSIVESLNEKVTAGQILLNIGVVYFDWNNYEKAIEYYNKALIIEEELKDNLNIVNTLNNIAIVYDKWGKDEEAQEYYLKALNTAEETGRKKEIATALLNIGSYYFIRENYNKALEFFRRSLILRKEIGDNEGTASSLMGIGNIYIEKKDYNKALDSYLESEVLIRELGSKGLMIENYKGLSDIYSHLGMYNKAFEYHKLFSAVKDSVFNENSQKQLSDIQTKYETEKKEKEIELLNKEKQVQDLKLEQKEKEIRNQRRLIIIFIIVFIIIVFFIVIVIIQNRKIKRAYHLLEIKNNEILQQKEEIEAQRDEIEGQRDRLAGQNEEISQQKEEIEAQRDEIEAQRDVVTEQRDVIAQQQKEVTDSIQYAKRIQNAMLPQPDLIKEIIPEGFILNMPRDIVSGDFYWFTHVNDLAVIAVADCTGHGVPGAFMSMIGISFLNEIVNKKNITDPAEILNSLKNNVINALHQTGKSGESQDGMDITIYTVDKQNNIMNFAGANNPLYLIPGPSPKETGERHFPDFHSFKEGVVEIKGDKMPVGFYHSENEERFKSHRIQLRKGDCIYTFSDGFADQFGGPKGKKFKYKPFKRLLTTISNKDMNEQKAILTQTLEDWIEGYDQIDDILIVGIRI